MLLGFKERVSPLTWSKKRELPEWARNIFSDDMVSAGFITDVEELESVIGLVKSNLKYYLSKVGERGEKDFTDAQNKYCFWQKQNPTHRKSWLRLGIRMRR